MSLKYAKEESESYYREKLATQLQKIATSPRVVEKYKVWGGVGVEADIYEEDKAGAINIYEVKVGTARPIDVYQLKMYWDGLIADGKRPSQGKLVATEIPGSVAILIGQINSHLKDANGNNYNLTHATFHEMRLKD